MSGIEAVQARVSELQSMLGRASSTNSGARGVLGANADAFDKALKSAQATVAPVADRTVGTVMSTARALTGGGAPKGLDSPYTALFNTAGIKHGIDPKLLMAVAKTESNFNPKAGSPAGAQGLMQFMPGTAKGLGVNPWEPASAIDGAARMLKGLIQKFGSVDLALAGYNAGPGAVQKYGGIPPYKETQNYVKKINALMDGAQ